MAKELKVSFKTATGHQAVDSLHLDCLTCLDLATLAFDLYGKGPQRRLFR